MFSLASECSWEKRNSEIISIAVMIIINTDLLFRNSIEVRGKCAKSGYDDSFFDVKQLHNIKHFKK